MYTWGEGVDQYTMRSTGTALVNITTQIIYIKGWT